MSYVEGIVSKPSLTSFLLLFCILEWSSLTLHIYCYMQDDDWDNKYLRSLYSNFLRSPHLLHTTTNAFVHFLSWSWTFFEPGMWISFYFSFSPFSPFPPSNKLLDVNLHTGFSWLGTGAIATKENVQRFIYSQTSLIAREHLILADMYFATWFNQVSSVLFFFNETISHSITIGTISATK